jgi:N-acetylmuramoyl-L-alanine amidase
MDQVSQVNRSSEQQADPLSETWSIIWRVILMATFLATLYTAWSPSGLFSEAAVAAVPYKEEEGGKQSSAFVSTPTPRSIRVGIIAGHWGNDSGAVCADGLKEVEVNLAVAALAQKMLVNEGVPVDLLKEKDPRLNGYNGTLLLSIHADSCDYINDAASGFKIAGNDNADSSNPVVPCLNENKRRLLG